MPGHQLIIKTQLMTVASIVTYNTDTAELGKCIDSLVSNGVERIVISDNSPADSLRGFCDGIQQVHYVYNNANLGYGAAHNVSIRLAREWKADYILVINSDVYFDKGVLDKIREYMDANSDVAQLIPNTVYPDGKLQYVVRLLPTPADLIFRRFMPKAMGEKRNYRYTLAFWDHKSPLNVAYHQGSFMFFRLSAFDKVGLFDERFFMYPEDIDITRRMHRHYRTMFWPEVTIVHAHRAASYKSKRMLKIHMTNMVKYFNKWGWIFDRERSRVNREILRTLGYKK